MFCETEPCQIESSLVSPQLSPNSGSPRYWRWRKVKFWLCTYSRPLETDPNTNKESIKNLKFFRSRSRWRNWTRLSVMHMSTNKAFFFVETCPKNPALDALNNFSGAGWTGPNVETTFTLLCNFGIMRRAAYFSAARKSDLSPAVIEEFLRINKVATGEMFMLIGVSKFDQLPFLLNVWEQC